jgi:hypothetical protein
MACAVAALLFSPILLSRLAAFTERWIKKSGSIIVVRGYITIYNNLIE